MPRIQHGDNALCHTCGPRENEAGPIQRERNRSNEPSGHRCRKSFRLGFVLPVRQRDQRDGLPARAGRRRRTHPRASISAAATSIWAPATTCRCWREARGHRVIPSVRTVNDLRRRSLYGMDIEDLNQKLDQFPARRRTRHHRFRHPRLFRRDRVPGAAGSGAAGVRDVSRARCCASSSSATACGRSARSSRSACTRWTMRRKTPSPGAGPLLQAAVAQAARARAVSATTSRCWSIRPKRCRRRTRSALKAFHRGRASELGIEVDPIGKNDYTAAGRIRRPVHPRNHAPATTTPTASRIAPRRKAWW